MSGPGVYMGLDLETTGLDPQKCRILEVYAQLFDEDLDPVGDGVNFVTLVPSAALTNLHEKVVEMHLASGLLVKTPNGALVQAHGGSPVRSLNAATDALCSLAAQCSKKPLLLGHSVQFDRGFIAHWMPELYAMLSHRQMDARTFIQALPQLEPEGGPKPHRAAEDLAHSVDVCRRARAILQGVPRG